MLPSYIYCVLSLIYKIWSIKTEDEEKTILPEELSHPEEPLKEARTKIEAIDTQINNTRPDRVSQSAYPYPFP